jgi:hypothetical protein
MTGLQLNAFQGNINKKYFKGKYPHTIPSLYRRRSWGILDFIFGFRGVIDPKETDFGDFRIDFLGEYDTKCERALDRE